MDIGLNMEAQEEQKNQNNQNNQEMSEEKHSSDKPRPGQIVKPQSQIEKEKKEEVADKMKEKVNMGGEDTKEKPDQTQEQSQKKPESQKAVVEETPIKEEPTEKKSEKSKAKLPIVPLIILILIIGLGAGGYYAYTGGLLDGVINGSMNLLQNGEEEPAPSAPVTQEQPASQVDQTKTLDYLEEQLEELESPVGALERNSNLRMFLNLDGSEL